MQSVPRLVRRGAVFYFRMAVPRDLIPRIQRGEIKVSLKTGDVLTATVRSRLLSNAFDVLFNRIVAMPHLDTATINERVRDYFQTCLNKSLEHVQLLPTDPFGDIQKEVAYLRDAVEAMRKQLAAQNFSHSVVQDATSLLQPSSLNGRNSDPEALHGRAAYRLNGDAMHAARLAKNFDRYRFLKEVSGELITRLMSQTESRG